MDEKAAFSERLRRAMEEAGYRPRPVVLEHEFNTRYWGTPVTVQGVRRWLKGESIPSQDKLQVLAEWLQVELHVLRYGEQPRYPPNLRKKRWEAALSGPEREVLEVFMDLPADERKAVRTVILALAKKRV